MDTEGLLLQVCVPAANVQERAGSQLLLSEWRFPAGRLELIWADGRYWGKKFASWVQENCGVVLEVVSRNELVNRQREHKGYLALPRRWVVERIFAWLGRCRRLSKDYEQNTHFSAAWVLWAVTGLMLRRLA